MGLRGGKAKQKTKVSTDPMKKKRKEHEHGIKKISTFCVSCAILFFLGKKSFVFTFYHRLIPFL